MMEQYYMIKNKTSKYYNFVTKTWVNNLTYACLTQNEEEANNLSIIQDSEIISCYLYVETAVRLHENIVDEVLQPV